MTLSERRSRLRLGLVQAPPGPAPAPAPGGEDPSFLREIRDMRTHGTANRLEQAGRRNIAQLLTLAVWVAFWALGGQCGGTQEIAVRCTWEFSNKPCAIRLAISPNGQTLAVTYWNRGVRRSEEHTSELQSPVH